ncbi:MAG: hypothetical protein AB8B83_07720 [Bdellovibrionales bacterium]
MADEDVQTSTDIQELAFFDADLMRQTLQLVIPDIDPPTGMLNMLAMDVNNLMLARDADGETIVGANPTGGLEAIEAGVMSALRDNHDGDGPYDTNIRHVQETLNLILSGADGAIASIAAQNLGNGKLSNEERAKRRAHQAAADAVLRQSTEAALADIEVDPEVVRNAQNYINLHYTDLEERFSGIAGTMIDPSATDEQKEKAVMGVAGELIQRFLNDPEFIEANPEFATATREEQIVIALEAAKLEIAEALVQDHGLSQEDALAIVNDITTNIRENEVHYDTLGEYWDSATNLANLAAADRVSEITAEQTQLTTAIAQRAYAGLELGETEAVELTQTDIDRLVVNFTMEYNEIDHLPVYVGTSLSEDGMNLINDGSSEVIYYSTNDDGSFYQIPLEYAIAQSPTHGAALADQIDGSGFEFDQLSAESIEYVNDMAGVHNQTELLSFLRETDNSHPFVMGVMGDPYFMDTVGNYALNSVIQTELERGQVFGNDPILEELIETTPDQIMGQQQAAIDGLIETRQRYQDELTSGDLDRWARDYVRIKLDGVNDQIAEMEAQLELYEQTITAQAEAEADVAAAEAIVAEQGFGEAEVARAKAEAAELETRAERIAAGEYTMEDVIADAVISKNSFLRVQAQHMNPDGMTNTDFEDMMNYSLVEQFPDGVPEEVMTALRGRFEEHGGTFLTETAAVEIPQGPQPDSIQALLDNNPELNSYVLSLAEQTHIPESDLVAELETRGLSASEIEGVMRIAETQMAVNIAPRIDTPHVTHGTMPANRGPGEPASGTFNAMAAVQPEAPAPAEPAPQTPAPEVMTREEIEVVSSTPAANSAAPPIGMAS